MLNRLFMLGAKDPEMVRIKKRLDDYGEEYIQFDVNPATAYKINFDHGMFPELDHPLVLIECGNSLPHKPFGDEIIIDHHHPDHLLGKEGLNSFELSSIGQLCRLLNITPDKQDIVAGVVDHSLYEAYRHHERYELTFDDVYKYRMECLLSAPGAQDIATVKAAIELAKEKILLSNKIVIGDQEVAQIEGSHGEGYSINYLAFVEAAQQLGNVPYLLQTKDVGDDRVKLCLGAASQTAVKAFMEQYRDNLTGLYGVPTRGFAGGYYS